MDLVREFQCDLPFPNGHPHVFTLRRHLELSPDIANRRVQRPHLDRPVIIARIHINPATVEPYF